MKHLYVISMCLLLQKPIINIMHICTTSTCS